MTTKTLDVGPLFKIRIGKCDKERFYATLWFGNSFPAHMSKDHNSELDALKGLVKEMTECFSPVFEFMNDPSSLLGE